MNEKIKIKKLIELYPELKEIFTLLKENQKHILNMTYNFLSIKELEEDLIIIDINLKSSMDGYRKIGNIMNFNNESTIIQPYGYYKYFILFNKDKK